MQLSEKDTQSSASEVSYDDLPTSENSSFCGVDKAWVQLANLKVFQPESSANSIDIVDLPSSDSTDEKRTRLYTKTLTCTKTVADYLETHSVLGGTRLM